MEVDVYLMVSAVVAFAIILVNNQRQKKRVREYIQQTGGVPPMFLMKAAEKKTKALIRILYDGEARQIISASFLSNTDPRTALIRELEKLERDLADKRIPLAIYDKKILLLLEKANRLPVTA